VFRIKNNSKKVHHLFGGLIFCCIFAQNKIRKIMKNIHVIATTQKSKIFFNHNKGFEKYQFSKEPFINGLTNTTNQNIYITSDAEIKEGDWKYNSKLDCIVQHNRENKGLPDELKKASEWCKKVILTTDSQLIGNGVQPILDEFLEWFCSKNGQVDFVEVISIEDEKN
jgi:hypothetical protein